MSFSSGSISPSVRGSRTFSCCKASTQDPERAVSSCYSARADATERRASANDHGTSADVSQRRLRMRAGIGFSQ